MTILNLKFRLVPLLVATVVFVGAQGLLLLLIRHFYTGTSTNILGTGAKPQHSTAAAHDPNIVRHKWVVSRGITTADGNSRLSWLINGQTPGPELRATKGDHLEITVVNEGNETITIHFHGVEQIGSMWSDGVPGITQYPIHPGSEFVYDFNVTQTGAYWYHSHANDQIGDGLKGPIFFRPNDKTVSSITALDLHPADMQAALKAEINAFSMGVADNVHFSTEYITQQWRKTNIEQLCVEDILINGKGQVICPNITEIQPLAPPIIGKLTARGCNDPHNTVINSFRGNVSMLDPRIWFECTPTSAPLEVFHVSQSDKFAVFNLINMGSLWETRVSIDSHSFYVFTADGSYVQPVRSHIITIPLGERFQILVPLDQEPGDYTIRVAGNVLPQLISGYAVLSYKPRTVTPVLSAPKTKNQYMNYAGQPINDGILFLGTQLHPFPPSPPPQGKADLTLFLNLTRTDAVTWLMNGIPMTATPDAFQPVLFNPANVAQLNPNAYSFVQNGSIVDIIMNVEVTPAAPGLHVVHPPHPMHKHNVPAYHLGTGQGFFPGLSVYEAWQQRAPGLNLLDPPLRDSYNTLATPSGASWTAIRYQSTNPGPTLIHCHLDPHLATGMSHLLMEGMELMKPIPPQYALATVQGSKAHSHDELRAARVFVKDK